MTVKVWDTNKISVNPLVVTHNRHKEFITGIDFNLNKPNMIATCSWDKRICLFDCFGQQPYR